MALAGAITSGFAGFMLFVGLTMLLLGIGAVIVGRPGWALIGTRKAGGIVLALGPGPRGRHRSHRSGATNLSPTRSRRR